MCRICLQENNDASDPMISPCKCAGTMSSIHLECLKEWLMNKRRKKANSKLVTYTWKAFECELCKQELPDRYDAPGFSFDLLKIENPFDDFLTLETVPNVTNKGQSKKSIYIVNIGKKSLIKLGRGRENDILIKDISVSRFHA